MTIAELIEKLRRFPQDAQVDFDGDITVSFEYEGREYFLHANCKDSHLPYPLPPELLD